MAVRAAMEEMAEEMVAAMKRLVPVDTGKLRDSINWCWGAPPRSAKIIDTVKGPKGKDDGIDNNRITIFAGDEEAYYAAWVEFGTQAAVKGGRVADHRKGTGSHTRKSYRTHPGAAAQPFFWPTWRAQRKALRSKMNRHINAAIKQIARAA